MIKKTTILLAMFFLAVTPIFAQYITPNDGEIYSLDDLVALSNGVLIEEDGVYILNEDLEIAASDTLQITQNGEWLIAPEVLITISGVLQIDAPDEFTINCTDEDEKFEGVRVEEDANIFLNNTIMKNGGGIRLITELNSSITNSEFYDNYGGAASGAVIYVSKGTQIIEGNTFIGNETPAVASAANATAAPIIVNNYIEANNTENSNRPQLNMGPTGSVNDTIKIMNNTIIGDRDLTRVGAISVSALIGGNIRAVIQDNTIQDNRYGITIAGGNVWTEITGNIIEDNDTEGDPMLGGSGINLLTQDSSAYEVYVYDNQIRRNLWGVTLQYDAKANFGDDENPGNNVFSENGNNGSIYALYNNTPNEILAKYNCWIEDESITLEDAEEVIFHYEDDNSLGEVIFDPVSCSILGVEDVLESEISIVPNPAIDYITLHEVSAFNQAIIYDVLGKEVYRNTIKSDSQKINFNLKSGVYFIQLKNQNQQITKKLVVK